MADDEKVGYEIDGEFVPFAFNPDHGKDLMLIDRITAMPISEFLDVARNGASRGTVGLAFIATSIRAKHPDWSVERIYRLVSDDLAGIEFLGGGDVDPPAVSGSEPVTEPSTTRSVSGSSGSLTLKASGTEPPA